MILLLWTPQTFHLFRSWGIHANMLYVDYCVYMKTVKRALYSTSPAHEAWHLGIWKLGADASLQLLEARPVASSTAGGSQKSYSAWNMLSHFCTYNRIVFRSCHTKLLKPVFPYRTITTLPMSHSGTECPFGFPFFIELVHNTSEWFIYVPRGSGVNNSLTPSGHTPCMMYRLNWIVFLNHSCDKLHLGHFKYKTPLLIK